MKMRGRRWPRCSAETKQLDPGRPGTSDCRRREYTGATFASPIWACSTWISLFIVAHAAAGGFHRGGRDPRCAGRVQGAVVAGRRMKVTPRVITVRWTGLMGAQFSKSLSECWSIPEELLTPVVTP